MDHYHHSKVVTYFSKVVKSSMFITKYTVTQLYSHHNCTVSFEMNTLVVRGVRHNAFKIVAVISQLRLTAVIAK